MDRGDHSTYLYSKAVDNEFSGNMIDVCPVGALTDKTFRFKSRVWFNKPYDAHTGIVINVRKPPNVCIRIQEHRSRRMSYDVILKF
jgi:NADH dehydrogenase/NADH:ubiquinone oxidoreductase subunit G